MDEKEAIAPVIQSAALPICGLAISIRAPVDFGYTKLIAIDFFTA
jgi:hypothetical protein